MSEDWKIPAGPYILETDFTVHLIGPGVYLLVENSTGDTLGVFRNFDDLDKAAEEVRARRLWEAEHRKPWPSGT